MGKGEGVGDQKIVILFFYWKKKHSITIKFGSLLEDGVYSVIANFEDFWLKINFIYVFIWAVTFLVFSFYYKMWLYHLNKSRSQQPFNLEKKIKRVLKSTLTFTTIFFLFCFQVYLRHCQKEANHKKLKTKFKNREPFCC